MTTAFAAFRRGFLNASTRADQRISIRSISGAAIGLAVLLLQTAAANTYYLDAENGDDANDGRSAVTAWQKFE